MDIIKIGKPIVTKAGTIVTRYIENGRLYKSIDFATSKNKVAKEKSLVKTVVLYGESNKPESVFDTFERRIHKVPKGTIKSKKQPAKTNTEKATVPAKQPTGTKNTIAKVTAGKTSAPAIPSRIVPVQIKDFKRETAQKLYSKIQQYMRLIGHNGSINREFKIMSEKGRNPHNPISTSILDDNADIYLSMKRKDNNLHLCLTRKNTEDKKSQILFDGTFNKDGQMINGRFPYKNLTFERYGANVRRMKNNENQYLPIAGNDREWDCYGARVRTFSESGYLNDDNSIEAAFELFIEFARLHTSIIK